MWVVCEPIVAMKQEDDAAERDCSRASQQVDHPAQASFGGSADHRSNQVIADHRHHDEVKKTKEKRDLVALKKKHRCFIWRKFANRDAKKDQNCSCSSDQVCHPDESCAPAAAGSAADGQQRVRKMQINRWQHHQTNPFQL